MRDPSRLVATSTVTIALLALAGACASPAPSAGGPAERPAQSASAGASGLTDPLLAALALRHVPDEAILHGDAVGGPTVVALPHGGFLLLVHEDTPDGGHLLRSDDGLHWSAVAREASPSVGRLSDIAATSSSVVLMGEDLPSDTSTPKVHAFRSADGRSWQPVADLAALREVVAGRVVAGSAGFAAMGGSPDTIAIAGPDGDGWTPSRIALGGEAGLWGIVPADPGFVTWGSANRTTMGWRVDRNRWDPIHLPTDAVEPIDMAWSGARGVVSGWDPTTASDPDSIPKPAAMETTDGGRTWAPVPTDLSGIDTVVTVGAAGAIYLFEYPNGGDPHAIGTVGDIGWQQVTVEAPGINGDSASIGSIAVSGRRVVAAGNTVGTGAGGDRVVIWTGQLP